MRKVQVALVGLVGTLTLAGFTGSGPEENLLLLRSSEEIALVDPEEDEDALRLQGAVASLDASAVVQAVQADGTTRVLAVDARSGGELWSRDVLPGFEVKVVSNGGRMAALGPPRGGDDYPGPRSATTLLLTGEQLDEPRTVTLAGNYEPEAFSVDGSTLFVVEYLPPLAPDRYRVRRLDLRTEKVEGVYTVDAELQEAMRGTARVQAASRDGRRLYTLYSVDHGDGSSHAFVHVLSLDELWAHCVDLPIGFGDASEEKIGLAVAPGGDGLYVTNASTGDVAEIDTAELRVRRSVDLGLELEGATAHAATGPDGTLYVGSGKDLVSIDVDSLRTTHRWDLPSPLSGVQVAGRSVYAGLRGGIVELDGRTRERLRFLNPPVGTIDQFGLWTRPMPRDRSLMKCAC